MSGDAFGIHIGLAIPSCANRHAGPSQLAGAPHTGPAGRTYGLVNLPNETCASSSALRAVAARPATIGLRARLDKADELFQQGMFKYVIVSGGTGKEGRSEAR